MARRFRKKSRSRKRKFRVKKFRSKFGRKRKIRKVIPISSRAKVKGWKTRIRTKKEVKRTTSFQANFILRNKVNFDAQLVLSNANVNLVWSNNGTAPIGNWFVPPVAGVNENQAEGTKYNIKYCELMFGLSQIGNINPTIPHDYIRLILVKERQPTTVVLGVNGGLGAILQTSDFFSPIKTKVWDVQFDKIYPRNTGYTYGVPASTVSIQNHMDHPMRFRFIIPLKHSMIIRADAQQFPLRIYFWAFNFLTDQLFAITDYEFVYYYTDV